MMSSAPEALKLLAHDIRWRLLQQLALGDRQVGELVDSVGERQNLVSYHLGLLRRSGLVRERRSSADGRDIYCTLDLPRLDQELAAGVRALHPGLAIAGPDRASGSPRVRVLFLCTGNSARSLIAEAILRSASAGSIEVASAGPRPAGIHPETLRVLNDRELATGELRSKGLEALDGLEFDYVISLCDLVREHCPEFPGDPVRIHWSFADPALVQPAAARRRAFDATARDIQARIAYLLPRLGAPAPAA